MQVFLITLDHALAQSQLGTPSALLTFGVTGGFDAGVKFTMLLAYSSALSISVMRVRWPVIRRRPRIVSYRIRSNYWYFSSLK